jgi:hypothetical protein
MRGRNTLAMRASSVVDDLDATIKDIRDTIFTLQARGGADQPSMRTHINQTVEE